MPGQVFISYEHSDRTYVEKLAGHLRDKGIDVWWDHHGLVAGDEFPDKIQAQIRTCAAMVVVLTPAAIASRWVRREINYADRRQRPILPVGLLPVNDDDWPITVDDLHREDVVGGLLPSSTFVDRLRGLAESSNVALGDPELPQQGGPKGRQGAAPTQGGQSKQAPATTNSTSRTRQRRTAVSASLLIVEDETRWLRIYRRAVRELGIKDVVEASGLTDAKRILRSRAFAVAVVDVGFDYEDDAYEWGLETIKAINALGDGTNIIAVSVRPDPFNVAIKFEEHGVFSKLSKGLYQPELLTNAIDRALIDYRARAKA